jgi:hypothetical protein
MDHLARVSTGFIRNEPTPTKHSLGDVVNEWRSTIDLQALPTTEGPDLVDTLKVPFTYCWSPALVPKPRDWAAHIG